MMADRRSQCRLCGRPGTLPSSLAASAQNTANQANGQLSTGPVTEAGKQTLKHGLSGKVHAALPGEEEALEKHCEGLYAKIVALLTHVANDPVAHFAHLFRCQGALS